METLLRKAAEVIDAGKPWVCGLKTRGWDEVKQSTERLVGAARTLRAKTA